MLEGLDILRESYSTFTDSCNSVATNKRGAVSFSSSFSNSSEKPNSTRSRKPKNIPHDEIEDEGEGKDDKVSSSKKIRFDIDKRLLSHSDSGHQHWGGNKPKNSGKGGENILWGRQSIFVEAAKEVEEETRDAEGGSEEGDEEEKPQPNKTLFERLGLHHSEGSRTAQERITLEAKKRKEAKFKEEAALDAAIAGRRRVEREREEMVQAEHEALKRAILKSHMEDEKHTKKKFHEQLLAEMEKQDKMKKRGGGEGHGGGGGVSSPGASRPVSSSTRSRRASGSRPSSSLSNTQRSLRLSSTPPTISPMFAGGTSRQFSEQQRRPPITPIPAHYDERIPLLASLPPRPNSSQRN